VLASWSFGRGRRTGTGEFWRLSVMAKRLLTALESAPILAISSALASAGPASLLMEASWQCLNFGTSPCFEAGWVRVVPDLRFVSAVASMRTTFAF